MAGLVNGFNHIVPTQEEAVSLIHILYSSLYEDSLQELEGDSPIGQALGLDNGSEVFWGVPRFSPGFQAWEFHNGQPLHLFQTMAELQDRLIATSAGLVPHVYPVIVETDLPEDNETIHLRFWIRLTKHGVGTLCVAFLYLQVRAQLTNVTEIHFSLSKVFINRVSPGNII